MYRTILVPLDGSKRAELILSHVESLAGRYGARVVLLQVVEPSIGLVTPYDMVPYIDPAEAQRHLTEATGYMANLEGELRAHGIHVKTVVESGPNCERHHRRG